MKKLQQFHITKFPSGRLNRFNYNIQRTFDDAASNQELISLGDSQLLRTVRSIRYRRNPESVKYDEFKLKNLLHYRNILKKDPAINQQQILSINQQISEMLSVPEVISVVFEFSKHYKDIVKQGLYINGYKYVRLLCSAGQARNNTVIFIREDYEKEVKQRLRCGAKDIPITKNKWNAYFALCSSSTYLVSKPNITVINDCEIKMKKMVDWVSPNETPSPLCNNEVVNPIEKELDFNLFDGCGAISVECAERWAKELDLDYVPAAFCIRCAYVKGMVFVVDFKKFAKEISPTSLITDIYGNTKDVQDIDIILTKSQFKLSGAYDSIEQYERCCTENEIYWGVSRVTPKYDDEYFRSNYQFCQVLDLKDEDIPELCNDTVNWLSNIVGNDINYTLLYLMGNACNDPNLDLQHLGGVVSDPIVGALILNHRMIDDEFVQRSIRQSINKKIKESYIGKLILKGNFSVMIPDMYAFMEHAFGMEVKGLLKEHEHYSHFWNQYGVTDVVAMRSPLTWRSEVNKLNLIKNEKTEEWFKHLYSGIVYNVWGCDCMLHADSDFDGDIVATTNNAVFLRRRYNNLPITYEKMTVPKQIIKEHQLYQADIKSFNSEIGGITNDSTTMYDVLARYENVPGKEKEANELITRLKLSRKAQGDAIDKAKGVKIVPRPSHWTKFQQYNPDIPKSITDFNNSIVANKKPYFFRYVYNAVGSEYVAFQKSANHYCQMIFQKSIDDLLHSNNLTKEENDYLENKYYPYLPVIDNNGAMNKICHYMEKSLKQYSLMRHYRTPEDVVELMIDEDIPVNELKVNQMESLYKKYCQARSSFSKHKYSAEPVIIDGTVYGDFSIYCEYLEQQAESEISTNDSELANLAIEVTYHHNPGQTKDFVWKVFKNGLLANIKKHRDQTTCVPIVSKDGFIEYLEKRYTLKEADL